MEPFTRLTAIAAPMVRANIDTDALYPLRIPRKVDPDHSNYGARLFGFMRYDPEGNPIDDFILNRPDYADARILVAGQNFGCGSSREQAVWALAQFGFRCVLAPSFSDIFAENAAQSGLLAAALPASAVEDIARQLESIPRAELTVDLEAMRVDARDGSSYAFELSEARRRVLLSGVSKIEQLRRAIPDIQAFQRALADEMPWIFHRSGGG